MRPTPPKPQGGVRPRDFIVLAALALAVVAALVYTSDALDDDDEDRPPWSTTTLTGEQSGIREPPRMSSPTSVPPSSFTPEATAPIPTVVTDD